MQTPFHSDGPRRHSHFVTPKRIAQFALACFALVLALAGLSNAPGGATPRTAYSASNLNGASSACDAFNLTILGLFSFDFPEPGWTWVNPSEKTQSVSGVVKESFPTYTDFPAVHDTHDQNTHLEADPGYEGLISDVNDPGEIEMEWETGTFNNETSGDPPERTFPRWAWPSVGDRAWFDGNWIFDCGHPTDVSGTNHYKSEIHSARAIASMRDQVRTMPGTGTTPVRITATDLYIHGRSGFIMDDLTCGQEIIVNEGTCTEIPYPHRGTPIDSDYDFDVCLPVKPFPNAVLATQMEVGPGNTIATDPEFAPEPSTGPCDDPAFGPMQLHVHVPLAGTGATPDDVLARKIYAGWVYPSEGLKHITASLKLGVLHEDMDLDPGDCECSFFYVNVDKSADEWFRLTPYQIPTDDDSGLLCTSHTNTLNDWDDDGGCGNGHLNFSGPNFDFYVVDGQEYTLRTVAWDQDCIDGYFDDHVLGDIVAGVPVPDLNSLAFGVCMVDPIEEGSFPWGENDPFDNASAVNLAPGTGARVAAGSNQFELFFDVNSEDVTTEDSADLSLIKACKPDLSPAIAGQQFTCTILVNNPGPGLPRNVVVHDSMLTNVDPAKYAMDTPTFTFSGGGGSVDCDPTTDIPGGKQFTCNAGTVPVGGSAIISYHITSQEGGDFNNFADVTTDSTDPNPNNNSSQSSVHVQAAADLAVTKTAPATGTAGTQLTYNLSVTNNGPSTATNVKISDVVPAGVSIVSVTAPGALCSAGVPGNAAQPTVCGFGSVAPGGVKTMQIVVLIAPGTLGQLNNDAVASSDTFDPNNANNATTASTQIGASADLVVTKTAQPTPSVIAGQLLTYVVGVKNNGPSLARNVTMVDTLPPGVSLNGTTISSGGGVCALIASPPNTLSCHLNDIAPGGSIVVYITVLVAPSVPDNTVIGNDASASSDASDPNGANNSAHVDVTVLAHADLAIVKTSDSDTYKASSTVAYTITVTNKGSSDAQAVVVTDNLPDTKQAIYTFDTGGCVFDGVLTLTCDLGTIPAGSSKSINVYVLVKGSKGQVVNTASVASATTDPVAANNTSTRTVLIGKSNGKKN